ncbi:hypothetical protein [Pseudomonas abietaniphila]|nr:hypothetical protein [Pseudomonas abietaniphila]
MRSTVGAGLLANVECQPLVMVLTRRIRQQAGSHKSRTAKDYGN